MSAIFGMIDGDGRLANPVVARALSEALRARGPDRTGVWLDRGLWSCPESRFEELPAGNDPSGMVITADARLDDRYTLIEAIGRSRFRTEVITDSDLILQAYLKWGHACLDHLSGDFAFALWDCRTRTLFCGRDHLGVKPLYYYWQGAVFVFCSEANAIALHAGVPVSLNEARIGDFLTPHLEGFDTSTTFYQEIFRLPPAHCLVFRDNTLTLSRYWRPEPKAIWHADDDQYRDALDEILQRAVSDRCRGTATPAVMLSGGIDSAAVAGIAGHLRGTAASGPVQTYSGISRDADCLESSMINKMAGAEGLVAHHYTVDDLASRIDDLFPFIKLIQEPFDIIMILSMLLNRQAAHHGHTYLLDGVDGDVGLSLSLSYPAFLFQSGRLAAGLRETMLQARNYYRGAPAWKLLIRYLRSAYTPGFIRRLTARYRLSRDVKADYDSSRINPGFAEHIGFAERLQAFAASSRKPEGTSHIDRYLSRLQHPFLTVGLERYDRVASLFSIEPRHPLLDKRVIDFFSALPWQQFTRHGWSKFLLRRVAERYVPKELCWRSGKEHLGSSFNKRFVQEKEQELFSTISANYDFVTRHLVFPFNGNYNICNSYGEFEALMKSSALVLWLTNGKQSLQQNEYRKEQKQQE